MLLPISRATRQDNPAPTPGYRAKQNEAENTARLAASGKRVQKKGKAEKSGFQPLGQNNPSMRLGGFARTDKSAFSQQGKLTQLLERLDERKEALIEQKNQLVESTLARGGTLEDIEEPLKGLDEQLDELSQIMTDAMSETIQLQAEQRKPGGKEKEDKPAPADAETDPASKMQALSGLSAQMETSEIVLKAGKEASGSARVATAQLKNDDLRMETRLYRRKAEAAASGEKISGPEMRSMQSARKAYAKQLHQVEVDIAAKTTELTGTAAENLSEVQRALTGQPEKAEAEKDQAGQEEA